ncbi:MAG: aspartate/glutamate racemase family protein, partial [Clostridia bacterium]|nr:aspartate/glutamate racemase family protein [Clostridia bacterium]
SGIGGLNLLYECAVRVPDAHYFFISDNKNVPYGNKSAEEIYRLTRIALDGIEKYNPAALVVACNTVTAQCIGKLRSDYQFPVIGIQPAVKPAAVHGGSCLVLATEATVHSASFSSLVERYDNGGFTVAGCRELAEYIEENIFNLPEKLPDGLLPDVKTDGVVLGCTHYAYVKRQIENYYQCPVYDGIIGTADHFAEIVGICNHFNTFLGKTDHLDYSKLKVTFLSGNYVKNTEIFKRLTEGML